MIDHFRTGAAILGAALGIWGAGITFGRSTEVAVLRGETTKVVAAQDRRIDEFKAEVKETLHDVKASAAKTAEEAEKTRRAVETFRAGVIGAKGHQ